MRIKRRYSNSLNAKLSGITFRRYETCMLSILLQKDVMDAFSSTRIGKIIHLKTINHYKSHRKTLIYTFRIKPQQQSKPFLLISWSNAHNRCKVTR